MSVNDLVDDSLIADFVTESREHLDSIEPDLLELEQAGANVSADKINQIFRAIHSIKGGAGFLAYEKLKNLSHIMESVLMKVRDGELSITPEITDVLLNGVDKLRAMVDDIQASEDVPCEDDIAKLTAILEGEAPTENEDAPEVTAQIDPALAAMLQSLKMTKEDALVAGAHGRNLFAIQMIPSRDMGEDGISADELQKSIESVGELVCSSVEMSGDDQLVIDTSSDDAFVVLMSTVLELDLVGAAIDVSPDRVFEVSPENFNEAIVTSEPVAPASTPKPEAAKPAESAQKDASAHKDTGSKEGSETLRVKVSLLTKLMNTAGELVLARNQLLRNSDDNQDGASLNATILQNINQVTTEIQEGIMQTRMQPVGTVFNKFPRVVRDLSRQLDKKIEIDVKGAEVELDKSIIELLSDPLTHIIRNCCDHALETPGERTQNGKSETGQIVLEAYHEGGQVNIAIRDDGRGIDADKIAEKAIEKGILTSEQAEKMGRREKVKLIFAAGFSTAETISDVSGRGVGMDVVRSNIEKLGGTVNVDSEVGKGTSVVLQLPLTLAIIPSIVVGVGEQRYAIPQVNVEEFVWVRSHEVQERIERIQGEDVLRLRGTILPLVRISKLLGMKNMIDGHEERRERIADRRSHDDSVDSPVESKSADDSGQRSDERRKDWRSDYNIVVVKIGANRFGLIVDRLFDTEEIVVKPLSAFLKGCQCFSGATILGDGQVITILDVLGIATMANMQFSDTDSQNVSEEEEDDVNAEDRRSVILFTNDDSEYFAVPQDNVLRLENFDLDDIDMIGDKEFIKYRGKSLPIVRLEKHMGVRPFPAEKREAYLIIPKGGDGKEASAGIMASTIIDAMDVSVTLQSTEIEGRGVAGSAIIDERITVFVNVQEILEAV